MSLSNYAKAVLLRRWATLLISEREDSGFIDAIQEFQATSTWSAIDEFFDREVACLRRRADKLDPPPKAKSDMSLYVRKSKRKGCVCPGNDSCGGFVCGG